VLHQRAVDFWEWWNHRFYRRIRGHRRLTRNPAKPRRTRWHLHQSLEPRWLLAVDWRNPVDALDVNSDTVIAPVDALIVINDLNFVGGRRLSVSRPADASFLDVSGDQNIAPIDALMVIDYLNSGQPSRRVLTEGTRLAAETEVTISVGT
jgi:hypothetical protein